MGTLEGQSALVTGGGRGIGEAIARRLAREGARVTVTGRTREELDAVASAVGGHCLVADLADRDSVLALARDLGAVDVLVNNAGVAESAPLADTTDALWDRALAVNVTACFVLCRALVPGMVARGRGRVVNVASNAGLTGYAYTSAYCASKHALVGLTRALALETARSGVTINAVCPGWVNTRMTDEAVARIARTTGRDEASARRALEAMSPQRRLLEPEEVAEAVAYLCHPDARGVHGQALCLDGGQVLA
ncbi:MAG: SDR family oxidoreductase [Deltaproteobacteria bacterium]|nr:SDR family oxidoreductase [Deltaproteobacteria bacterium]